MRPDAILKLLNSVEKQSLYPNEILIVDGSKNELTKEAINNSNFDNVRYFKVEDSNRGLTKQRNFGISKVSSNIDIVCFLDDDIILEDAYFKNLIATYGVFPDAGGVGGYIINEVNWRQSKENETIGYENYEIDGWYRNIGQRNIIRKKLGLFTNNQPCVQPEYSNGLSVAYLPPNNKTYVVEYFMGGVSSFRKNIVDTIKFSTYFEGYGLYEDLEYCLRVSRKHKLYLNTSAKLYHYHEPSGRPNKYNYGKMVVRNGWFVWRTRNTKPTIKACYKWYAISIVLTMIRFANSITTSNRIESFTESIGRLVGLLSLIFNKPK